MASSARIDELRKKFDENPRRYFAPLANEYRKAGDLEQAIFICEEYLPQQPGHMSGHIVYGQALFELNRHEEARTVFETALSLDPENLIALRHLGDIARMAGDASSARVWYQRVLEADPRNEEIAQLMLTLLAPESAPPTPAPQVDHAAPTPLSSPAVSQPAAPAAAASSQSTAFEVEKAEDTTLGERLDDALGEMEIPAAEIAMEVPVVPAPPVSPSAAPAASAPADLAPTSRHSPKEDELLDLDAFDLGGVPLSSLRASQPVAAQPEPAGRSAEAAGSELTFEMPGDADASPSIEAAASEAEPASEAASEPEEVFEADPFAIAATPGAFAGVAATPEAPAEPEAEPPIELATDLALGLPSDTEQALMAAAEKLDGLQSFEPGIIGDVPEVPPALETEDFFDLSAPALPAEPTSAAAEEPTPELHQDGEISASEPATPELAEHERMEPAEAFVTETMATLYLQQGHLELALDTYRRLVDQRPDDAGLRERMAAVEAQASAMSQTTAPADVERASAEPTAHSYAGPTIREFLSGLMTARRTASEPVAPWASEPSGAELTQEQAAFHAAETPLSTPRVVPEPSLEPEHTETESVEAPQATQATARPTPSSSATVSGSLGALFSGADAAVADTAAAETFAEAFAPDGPETAPLQGMPAHRASSELSLNHVFKGSTQPRAAGSEDFSFDQFFTEDAATEGEPAPASSADAPIAPAAEGADDIAQFNAWLNGLKKT